MVDFDIPDDVREIRSRVAAFVDDVVKPAEPEIGTRPFFDIVKELQAEARAAGLWCPFVPVEYGGMGLGHLANAIVQIEVGRSFSHLGAWALNCMGPQDATMLTLIEHGTDDQKEQLPRPAGQRRHPDLLLDDRAGRRAPTPRGCRPPPSSTATTGCSTARSGSPPAPASRSLPW